MHQMGLFRVCYLSYLFLCGLGSETLALAQSSVPPDSASKPTQGSVSRDAGDDHDDGAQGDDSDALDASDEGHLGPILTYGTLTGIGVGFMTYLGDDIAATLQVSFGGTQSVPNEAHKSYEAAVQFHPKFNPYLCVAGALGVYEFAANGMRDLTTNSVFTPGDVGKHPAWVQTKTKVSGKYLALKLGWSNKGDADQGLFMGSSLDGWFTFDRAKSVAASSGAIQLNSARDEQSLERKFYLNVSLMRLGYIF